MGGGGVHGVPAAGRKSEQPSPFWLAAGPCGCALVLLASLAARLASPAPPLTGIPAGAGSSLQPKNLASSLPPQGNPAALGTGALGQIDPNAAIVEGHEDPKEGGPAGHRVMEMLGVLLWMSVWWVSEAVPVALTALLPLALFPILGILDSGAVAKTYVNDTIVLLLGSFILALAIQRTNLHRRLALQLLLFLLRSGSSSPTAPHVSEAAGSAAALLRPRSVVRRFLDWAHSIRGTASWLPVGGAARETDVELGPTSSAAGSDKKHDDEEGSFTPGSMTPPHSGTEGLSSDEGGGVRSPLNPAAQNSSVNLSPSLRSRSRAAGSWGTFGGTARDVSLSHWARTGEELASAKHEREGGEGGGLEAEEGLDPYMMLLGFCVGPAFISMWISNTATAVMMLPMALGVLQNVASASTSATPPGASEDKMVDPGPHHKQAPPARGIPPSTKAVKPSSAGASRDAVEAEGVLGTLGGSQHPGRPGGEGAQDSQGPTGFARGDVAGTASPPGASAGGGLEGGEVAAAMLRFSRGVVLAVAYGASVGGIGTIVGTGPNLVLAGVWRSMFPAAPPITFMRWFLFAAPLAAIFSAGLWALLCVLYCPPSSRRLLRQRLRLSALRSEERTLGPMSAAEKFVMLDFAALVVLWLARSTAEDASFSFLAWLPQYIDDGTLAITAGLLVFLAPVPRHTPSLKNHSPSGDRHTLPQTQGHASCRASTTSPSSSQQALQRAPGQGADREALSRPAETLRSDGQLRSSSSDTDEAGSPKPGPRSGRADITASPLLPSAALPADDKLRSDQSRSASDACAAEREAGEQAAFLHATARKEHSLRAADSAADAEGGPKYDTVRVVRTWQPVLTWSDATDLPWSVVLLLSGGFALSAGISKSGLSAWIAQHLRVLSALPAWLLVPSVAAIVTFCTEFSSNAATATVFLPLLASTAVLLRMHPLLLMLPATIGCSFAFMLPIATPPNAVAYATGYLRMSDMVWPGLLLNCVGILLLALFVPTLGAAVFGLHEPFDNLTWLQGFLPPS